MIDIFGFRIVVPRCRRLLHRARRAAPAVQAGAGPLQGLHRDPQGQRLPVAAHHAGRARSARTVEFQIRTEAHARGGRDRASPRTGCTRPASRRATSARAPGHASGCSRCSTSRTRRATPREFLGARQDRPVPRRGLRVHAQEQDPGAAARRDARSTSPTRSTPTSATARVAAKVNGEPVPLRTELQERRRGRGRHRARCRRPNPAWLGFVRTGRARSKIRHYLKTLEQEESQRARREAAGAGAARRRPATLPADDDDAPRRSGQSCCASPATAAAPSCSPTSAWASKIATIVAKRLAQLLAERGEQPDALTAHA